MNATWKDCKSIRPREVVEIGVKQPISWPAHDSKHQHSKEDAYNWKRSNNAEVSYNNKTDVLGNLMKEKKVCRKTSTKILLLHFT